MNIIQRDIHESEDLGLDFYKYDVIHGKRIRGGIVIGNFSIVKVQRSETLKYTSNGQTRTCCKYVQVTTSVSGASNVESFWVPCGLVVTDSKKILYE